MNLEEQLKLALQRKQPPPGFRDRVLAACGAGSPTRAGAGSPTRAIRRLREPALHRRLAAAALLTLLIGGTTAHYVEQRREGERAKEQVLLALRITSHKLRDTREHVLELSK